MQLGVWSLLDWIEDASASEKGSQKPGISDTFSEHIQQRLHYVHHILHTGKKPPQQEYQNKNKNTTPTIAVS